MRRFPRVEVEWVDSVTASSNWSTLRDLKRDGARRCTSVGYLVNETEDVLTLAQSLGYDEIEEAEEFGQPITIPRVALLSEPRELRR